MPFCPGALAAWPVRCGICFAVAWLATTHASFALTDSQSYRIRSWRAEDGLPQNSVTSILQTRDGYLWLGTFNGLARFDGVQFTVHLPDNTPGLPSNRILALFENSDGSLLVATEDGDLAIAAKGNFKTISPARRKIASAAIRTITKSSDGIYWLLTFDWRLLKFSQGQLAVASTNWPLAGTRVFGLANDSLGNVWIGTDRELAVYREGKFVLVWGQSQEKGFGVAGLGKSRYGGCWVLANDRLRRFSYDRCEEEAGTLPRSKAMVVAVSEARAGQVWVGTYGDGLFCFLTNGPVIHFSATNGLGSDLIRCIQEDHEGNIWVGTDGSGLARLKRTIFHSYDRSQGLSDDCVSSVCEGDDDELWIATNGHGVDRMKNGHIQWFGAEQGLTNEFVWSVYQDHEKRVWAGTWGGGAFRLDGEKFVPVECPQPVSDPVVCAFYQDTRGLLWVGQQRPSAEILVFEHGNPRWLSLPSTNSGTDVRTIAEDRDGNVWIGTFEDGLYRIKDNQTTRFGLREGLKSERIRALYADPQGVLWIGTSRGGLSCLQNEQVNSFTTAEGLADDFVLHIEEDGHGFLWCSAGSGVFRVSRQELERFSRHEIEMIHCFVYTKADGLPSLEVNGGCQPSGCKTRDGRLWFPTVAGLAVVEPDTVKINPLPPPVIIERVILEGNSSPRPGKQNGDAQTTFEFTSSEDPPPLQIPPGKQRFEFHYTGLSFTAPEKVQFKYRLEPLEEQWVDAGSRREAHYSHLSPGKYKFQVIACNNDGVWNEAGASLAMIVLPHFWQTWLFRIFAGALVLILFAVIFEIRLASERRLNRLRLRIARDLHDEVGSNLGTIALLGEVMQKQPAPQTEELSEVRRIAVQTIESLRDIVWFLDPASDNLDELVVRMHQTASAMLRGIAFDFHQAGDAEGIKPSLELRRNLIPAFKEILHNIIQHARATRVDILIELSPRQFLMRISDNGVGFDESTVRAGNGLKNLRRRAADLEAVLQIESRPGHGTSITLRSPIT